MTKNCRKFLWADLISKFVFLQVIDLLNKLYAFFMKEAETKAATGALDSSEKKAMDENKENNLPQGRKANFFDRKRFVNYEQNNDSDQDNKDSKQ